MKQKLNIATWNRKEHFEFFKNFHQPYYGLTVSLNCTRAYEQAKMLGVSFYSYYLHKTLVAMNSIDNMRYRIEDNDVYLYDKVDASCTILRDDQTFGFSYMKYVPDIIDFNQIVKTEIERVKSTTGLFTTGPMGCVTYFSALPWVNFTAISEAYHTTPGDSCPKIAVGKLVDIAGQKLMPYTIHSHHALVDGYHVGLFLDMLQKLLDA